MILLNLPTILLLPYHLFQKPIQCTLLSLTLIFQIRYLVHKQFPGCIKLRQNPVESLMPLGSEVLPVRYFQLPNIDLPDYNVIQNAWDRALAI